MLDASLEKIVLHDLKNPLSGITATVELFLDGSLGDLTAEQRAYMGNIKISAKIIANHLSDLQDINHWEESQQKADKQSIPVESLLRDLSWLKDFAGQDEKDLEIKSAKGVNVLADQNLITRVLEDLILNAIKQTPRRGKIELKITADGKETLFEVYYQGEGIPPEYLSRVFDKNFKTEHPELRAQAGAGLSFYFCRLAVAAHGGKLAIESRPGQGSRIYFALPHD